MLESFNISGVGLIINKLQNNQIGQQPEFSKNFPTFQPKANKMQLTRTKNPAL